MIAPHAPVREPRHSTMALHPVNVLVALLVVAGVQAQVAPADEPLVMPGAAALFLQPSPGTELRSVMSCLSQSKTGAAVAAQEIFGALQICATEKLDDVKKLLPKIDALFQKVSVILKGGATSTKECFSGALSAVPACTVRALAGVFRAAHAERLLREIARLYYEARYIARGLLADSAECMMPQALESGMQLLSVGAGLVKCLAGGQAALL